jgi:predicted nucleic acid-binding protein
VAAELFVDTSAWYPLMVAPHPDHARVASVLRQAIRDGRRLVTTNLIVAEAHALLLARAGREAALRFAQTVRSPPNLVLESSAELEMTAVTDWLARYTDQDFSYTDAVSFAVMASRGITEALTLDRHFSVAGFMVVAAVDVRRRRG